MVRGGVLGEIRKVIVEYHQGWLATEQTGKQADWRTDPARSGPAGALGDIGTHAEQLVTLRDRPGTERGGRRADRPLCRAGRSTTTPACCCAFRAAQKAS